MIEPHEPESQAFLVAIKMFVYELGGRLHNKLLRSEWPRIRYS